MKEFMLYTKVNSHMNVIISDDHDFKNDKIQQLTGKQKCEGDNKSEVYEEH